MKTLKNINLDDLENSWSAEVELNNGQIISIWYTAWPMSKHTIKKIISVASDYPKHKIKNSESYKFIKSSDK